MTHTNITLHNTELHSVDSRGGCPHMPLVEMRYEADDGVQG
jgi:hypothetical protein